MSKGGSMNVKQAVVFAILMEYQDGILGKAPSYIEEKLRMCERLSDDELFGPLDSNNRLKLKR